MRDRHAHTRAPLIGITGHITETSAGYRVVAAGQAYIDAVRLAGGFPMLLPPVVDPNLIEESLDRVDGLLITGGKDIDPERYGERILNSRVVIEPERDAFEIPLTRSAVDRNFPVLGICRGLQVLNVALGGSLWQDLPAQAPSEISHYQHAARGETTHAVELARDSLVGELARGQNGRVIQANSFHHQAAKAIAPSLVPVAHSPDGTIEALELPNRDFVVAVQWHPEHLVAEHQSHRSLFEGLIEAARKYRITQSER